MDSLNIVNLKLEKATAIFSNRRLQTVAILFRFIELFFLLIVISRFSVQLPSSFNLSAEYFRPLAAVVCGPKFVFLIGNAIVLVLLLRSGWLRSPESAENKPSLNFGEECVDNSLINYQRKESNDTVTVRIRNDGERKISRSRSENLSREGDEKLRRQLRRSATERCLKISPAVNSFREDEMSSEEFRQTVEDFIARQQRFLREQELSATDGH
ncbi:uncharacterized protein LOC127793580 [Diospyros lotus]|uniref:uncharacterized protein LOC127793580 n=1 Tax=Diospyros lotus TaxID=55363 RepID=UPI00224E6D60|nr:uncharacterized protein LOC127793580 [Diospyros lotus]